jgi:hypothetical protein
MTTDTGRPVVTLTSQHKALADFEAGEWYATERVFPAPGASPIERKGRASYRLLVDGRAGLLETQLENPDGSPYQSMTLATWNVTKARFEGVFMDVHSFDGFDPLTGSKVTSLDAERKVSSAVSAQRTWDGSVTMPRMSRMGADTEQMVGVDRLPVRLVENRINENEWMLLGIMLDPNGDEFVGMEWTFTR